MEREAASPIEKIMTEAMLISPEKIELDDNDDVRIHNEDVKRIRDSDEEDMFTATPEELPYNRFVLVFNSYEIYNYNTKTQQQHKSQLIFVLFQFNQGCLQYQSVIIFCI